jgi:hypothetical protein
MAHFEQLLLVEKIKVRPKSLWMLHRDLVFHSDILGCPVRVPTKFVTDFASVPRWLILGYALLGGKGDEAAVIHDWLYSTQKYTRDIADKVFEEALVALGYSAATATLMYTGVSAGGWVAWRRHNVPQFPEVVALAPDAFEPYTPA